MKKIGSIFVCVCFPFLIFAGVFTHLACADKAADAKTMKENSAAYLKSDVNEKSLPNSQIARVSSPKAICTSWLLILSV